MLFERQNEPALRAALGVARSLRKAGHQALFAGGCVRDILLGRRPADYDVATDATPDEVRRLFGRTLLVGAQFGVVIVLVGRQHVEVATFRSEGGYADGRHPDQVRFADAREDAIRRDFTINGMFMDPDSGRVIDYVGGRDDLAAGVVRAIGQPAERFAEDHLRMLRAVRFACVLEFRLDPATEEAVRQNAPRIADVSAERIWQEWEKLLASPGRAAGVGLAQRAGLLAMLWPELASEAEAVSARLAHLPAQADAVTALACQFLGLPSERVHQRCRDLALDNRRRNATAWLVAHARDLVDAALDVVALKKLVADEQWPRLVHLATAAAAVADTREAEQYLRANLAHAAALPADQIAPRPLINGNDAMALGLSGPAVGRVLQMVYDAQLAGEVLDRQGALDLAARLASQPTP